MMVLVGISAQLSNRKHDETLARSDQVRHCRTETRDDNVVRRRGHRVGIMDGLVRQHAPVKEYFGQGTHEIRKENVHKGNSTRCNARIIQCDAGTPGMNQCPGSSQQNSKTSSQPNILRQGDKNINDHGQIKKPNGPDRASLQMIHPVVRRSVQQKQQHDTKQDHLVPQYRRSNVCL